MNVSCFYEKTNLKYDFKTPDYVAVFESIPLVGDKILFRRTIYEVMGRIFDITDELCQNAELMVIIRKIRHEKTTLYTG